ncbi:MAG: FAD-dependent oxidoreductase [Jatrophihabitans sp.]|nr:FAD-dependent oxidoreductase [Jatrophihabitans sp.]
MNCARADKSSGKGGQVVTDYRGVSLWFDQLPGPLLPRPPLDRDIDVDVAIVGAGFTGLWTA